MSGAISLSPFFSFYVGTTDPLAARTFRKDGVAQIDKAWGAAPDAPAPVKRSHSHSRHKHKHHHHHHHHREKESTKSAAGDRTALPPQPAKKSLLEEHLERVRSGAAPAKRARSDTQQGLAWRMPGTASGSSSSGTAYWDRERDMEAVHMSRQSVADLLGRADALGTRFRSGGSSTRFV